MDSLRFHGTVHSLYMHYTLQHACRQADESASSVLRFEAIMARCVRPFLGERGLYDGSDTPVLTFTSDDAQSLRLDSKCTRNMTRSH